MSYLGFRSPLLLGFLYIMWLFFNVAFNIVTFCNLQNDVERKVFFVVTLFVSIMCYFCDITEVFVMSKGEPATSMQWSGT